jgi:hypothetical protein
MSQVAPWPDALEAIVNVYVPRPGIREVTLEDRVRDTDADRHPLTAGLTLCIYTDFDDAYHPGRKRGVVHFFIVPAATYDPANWERWFLDQLLKVSLHEECENFNLDGAHPFAPNHGPGRDPYTIWAYADETDRRRAFTGALNPGAPA